MCTHKDLLEAIEAMNKRKYERTNVLSRVNRAIKVSHDEIEDSLVDTGVHDALAKFPAHDKKPRQTREAAGPSGISGLIYVRCDLSRFFVVFLSRITFDAKYVWSWKCTISQREVMR